MSEGLTYITGVSHIGIAVPSIDKARIMYEDLGFKSCSEKAPEPDYGVSTMMMTSGNYTIELLEPLEEGKESPIDRYISSKPFKMYHLAYTVSDFRAQIAELEKMKYVMIGEPRPSQNMKGKMAVFMFNRNMGIIEIVEE